MTDTQATDSFRLAYVPGVTPGKWVRTWEERLPHTPLTLVAVPAAEGEPCLRGGEADAGLVRLPVDRTGLSAIPLYTETTVVVIPKDHWLAAAEQVTLEDLDDDIVLHPLDDTLAWESGLPGLPAKERPESTEIAIQLVAAGIGLLLVPQSLARLHHRKDLTYRPVADVPQSQIALSWLEDRTTDLVEEFIGIVRGRTVNSSRGRGAQEAGQSKQEKQKQGKKPPAKQHGRQQGKQQAKQQPKSSARPRRGSGGSAGSGGSGGSGGSSASRRQKPRRRS